MKIARIFLLAGIIFLLSCGNMIPVDQEEMDFLEEVKSTLQSEILLNQVLLPADLGQLRLQKIAPPEDYGLHNGAYYSGVMISGERTGLYVNFGGDTGWLFFQIAFVGEDNISYKDIRRGWTIWNGEKWRILSKFSWKDKSVPLVGRIWEIYGFPTRENRELDDGRRYDVFFWGFYKKDILPDPDAEKLGFIRKIVSDPPELLDQGDRDLAVKVVSQIIQTIEEGSGGTLQKQLPLGP